MEFSLKQVLASTVIHKENIPFFVYLNKEYRVTKENVSERRRLIREAIKGTIWGESTNDHIDQSKIFILPDGNRLFEYYDGHEIALGRRNEAREE